MMSRKSRPLLSPSPAIIEFLDQVLPGVPVVNFSLHFRLDSVGILEAEIQLQEKDLEALTEAFEKHGVSGNSEDILELVKKRSVATVKLETKENQDADETKERYQ